MAEESFEEKTEKATPRKKQKAKERGEVAKSRELPSVAVLISALMAITVFGSFMISQLQTIMKKSFSFLRGLSTPGDETSRIYS